MIPANSVCIRPFERGDRAAILDICIAAFTPIHESFEAILGTALFRLVYPDWRSSQRRYVEQLCDRDEASNLCVAQDSASDRIVGFVHYSVERAASTGEIGINAVAPECQGRGIGSMMYRHVLGLMADRGVKLVQVATGGDASHQRARRAYERTGFRPLPLVRFYKAL